MTISHGADEAPALIDVQLDDMQRQLDEIKVTLDFIKDTIVRADSTIDKVAAEVMPTLNQVMESPMLRMLTGGKKK